MNADWLLGHYEQIADAPDAVQRLRRFILDLAVRGKLVEQDPNDEPAAELLKRIGVEKARLVKAELIKRPKQLEAVERDDTEFCIPSSWCWTRLGEVTSYIQRGKSPKYASADGSPVVSQKCVQWHGLDLDKVRKITYQSLVTYADIRFLREGDLLWNSTGTGTIGRIIRLIDPPERLVCDSHVTVVRCLFVSSEYIRTWLRTGNVYGLIEERAAGSTNQVELTAQMALNQVVPLPPLAEQRRIVAKVDELMALCDRLEAARTEREATRDRMAAVSLIRLNDPDPDPVVFRNHAAFALENLAPLTTRTDQIKALRQTILNLAVRGKLVEQDPNDEPAAELLKRIAAEKARLVKAKKISKQVAFQPPDLSEASFDLPGSWDWCPSTYPSYIVSDRGKKIQTKAVAETGKFPVVDQGKVLIRGYHNDANKVIRIKEPIVLFGDHTREMKLIDFDFIVGGDGVKLLHPVSLHTAYYFLALQWLPLESRGYGRHFKLLKASFIPLPPLAEQHRIVDKVDELMALCGQLEASLITGDETRRRLLDALLYEALPARRLRDYLTKRKNSYAKSHPNGHSWLTTALSRR